jgi:IS30 family transposase
VAINHGESGGIAVSIEVFCGGNDISEKNGGVRLVLAQLFVNLCACFEEPVDIGFWRIHWFCVRPLFEIAGQSDTRNHGSRFDFVPCASYAFPSSDTKKQSKLRLDWSPEQISGWLKIQYPEDESLRVSHETIYRSLFIQARGVLKKELLGHLRSKRRMRRSQHSHIFRDRRGQIVDAVSIRERPAESRDRAIPGHWEGDLISGSKNSHMVTLVERHSRFTALVKVPSKDTAVVVAALTRHVRKLPTALRRSLTWDRGLEMAKHKTFTVATNVKVYFCDPQSPWQRGSNENTNGLLRQYFPRGTDLSGYTQSELDKVALRLNQRPRKTLGFQTPASKLRASAASTH